MKLPVNDGKRGGDFLCKSRKLISISLLFAWLLILWQTSVNSQSTELLENSERLSFSLGYRKSDGFDTHQSRIYGRGQWSYPFWVSLENMVKNGVSSEGNFGSTDGNWKISAFWEIGNFNIYARATRQKENAGGWFIVDSWPELKDRSPTDPSNGDKLIDGKIVRFDDLFWAQGCKSSGDNLHQYLSDNVMVEAGYTIPVGNDEIIAKLGFDANTTRVGSEKRERYKYESEYHEFIASKKLNASLHFFIPHDFERSFFAYDILGVDKPLESKYNKYVINSLRWQHMSVPDSERTLLYRSEDLGADKIFLTPIFYIELEQI